MGDIGELRRHYDVLSDYPRVRSAARAMSDRMPDPDPIPAPQPEPLPVPDPVPTPGPPPQPPSELIR
jgi:hypothetical protein